MNSPLFFLHIPRTGGTTLDALLTKSFSPEEILKIYTKEEYEQYRYIDSQKLNSIRYITGHLLLQNYDPPTLYNSAVRVITFLRDPVKRLHSEYIFYKTWPNQHLYRYIRERKLTFRDYLMSREDIIKYRGKNFMTRSLSGKGFRFDQKPLAALAFAKRMLEKNFFFFGLTEYFAESIFLLSKKIALPDCVHDQHNKLGKKVKEPLSPADRSLAVELNSADIELFAFAKALFLSRLNALEEEERRDLAEFIEKNTKYQADNAMTYANSLEKNGIYLPKDQ